MAALPSQFPFVSIQGDPKERGRQYGRQALERIKRSIALYSGRLDALGLSRADLAKLVREFSGSYGHFTPDHVEEMQGIAEGAGVDFEDIALVNARTEIVAKARRQMGKPDDNPDGCTGVIVLPDRSSDRKLIHAQNWDWRSECVETAIVLRIKREDGPDILTFTEAGGLARCGLNSAGIAITANYLESDLDYTQSGVPLPFIRRAVLEQEHIALAMRIVAITPKSCSNNMMLSHRDGWGIDFECAPAEVFPLLPQDGLLVHANHWVGPIALSKVKEGGLASSPDSLYRDWRVAEHLKPLPRITTDDVKTALFDDFGAPYAVCRPPKWGATESLSATVAMVVLNPADGTMDVAPLPALNKTFTRYSLSADPVVLPTNH